MKVLFKFLFTILTLFQLYFSSLSNQCSKKQELNDLELIGIVNIVRHGARSSGKLEKISKSYFYGNKGSQLTLNGMNQLKQLALFYNKNYGIKRISDLNDNENQFIYIHKNKIVVYDFISSPKSRAIFSANSFISSLYPEKSVLINKDTVSSNENEYFKTDLPPVFILPKKESLEEEFNQDYYRNYKNFETLTIIEKGLFNSHKLKAVKPLISEYLKNGLYNFNTTEMIKSLENSISIIPEIKNYINFNYDSCKDKMTILKEEISEIRKNNNEAMDSCTKDSLFAFNSKLSSLFQVLFYQHKHIKNSLSKETQIHYNNIFINKHFAPKILWENSNIKNIEIGLPWIKRVKRDIDNLIKSYLHTSSLLKNNCSDNDIENRLLFNNKFYFGHQENIEAFITVLQNNEALKSIVLNAVKNDRIHDKDHEKLYSTLLFPYASILSIELYAKHKTTNDDCYSNFINSEKIELTDSDYISIKKCYDFYIRILVNNQIISNETYVPYQEEYLEGNKRYLFDTEKISNIEGLIKIEDFANLIKILESNSNNN